MFTARFMYDTTRIHLQLDYDSTPTILLTVEYSIPAIDPPPRQSAGASISLGIHRLQCEELPSSECFFFFFFYI